MLAVTRDSAARLAAQAVEDDGVFFWLEAVFGGKFSRGFLGLGGGGEGAVGHGAAIADLTPIVTRERRRLMAQSQGVG